MIMSQEQAIFKAKKEFEQIEATVRQAAVNGQRIDLFEHDLWGQMLNLDRKLMQAFVELQGSGDLGSTLEDEGRTLNRLDKLHGRRYVSVFGEFMIERTVYGTRETQKHEVIPLDATLGLPDGDHSCLLQQWDQAFCAQGSYARSQQSIERILNLGQSVRSLEAMNQSMAKDVESFRDSEPSSSLGQEGEILVLTADGKGVPMRKDKHHDAPAKYKRRTKSQKANKKRLDASVKYLENNRTNMRYDEYLANGYPIGSGVVEGVCRYLIKDRMELTGMRWRTEGAQAMLDLRAVFLNDDWERFQQSRIEENDRKLYPYKELVTLKYKNVA